VDYYRIEIDDAIQGRNPAEVAVACIETLDPFFCDRVERSGTGSINLVDNQLQNIGGIETSGLDIAVSYTSPQTRIGQFRWNFDATHLAEYTEETEQPDGSTLETDFEGSVTDETFQRSFPEWRFTSTADWFYRNWSASLIFRFVSELDELANDAPTGNELDSEFYTDVRAGYRVPFLDDELMVTLGVNNLFDNDPPVCRVSCGVIGMSPISHDLPGRLGFLRVSYRR